MMHDVGGYSMAGADADVHVERDQVIGVACHAGHVGRVELPRKQRRGAEHLPLAMPQSSLPLRR
jgi:hypothetical protein